MSEYLCVCVYDVYVCEGERVCVKGTVGRWIPTHVTPYR